MADKIIEVKNLHKEFRLKQKESGLIGGFKAVFKPNWQIVQAVEKINFSVKRGEVLAFIGPNGAGKSTTIKMLTGILFPTSGEISVLGFNPQTERQQLAYKIGSVFGQRSQLSMHLPAQDSYDLLSKIYELKEVDYQERLKFLVEAFEINDLLKTPVRKLSLGQRMRCEIVASLLHRPEVLFLDEPTIGLDVVAKQHIREVIKYLNKKEKVTIFLTSHDAGDIEALAERTIVINHGKLIYDGATDKLQQEYIKNKIIEIITADPIKDFSFAGGKVVNQDKYSIRVELDLAKNSIDKLLEHALAKYNIKDINIFDPSLEEIIAAIYRSEKNDTVT
ncbi:MAG: ATP-binding cassette domain-containing protein [bacterium]